MSLSFESPYACVFGLLISKWLMRERRPFSSSLVARPRLHPEAIRETGPRYCPHQQQPHFNSLLSFCMFKVNIVAKCTSCISFASTSALVAEIWRKTFVSSFCPLAFAKLKTCRATQPISARRQIVRISSNLLPFHHKSFDSTSTSF